MNIDNINKTILAKEVKRVKSYTPAQRENVFNNIVRTVPNSAIPLRDSLFRLTNGLYDNKEFHQQTGLPYSDPNNENGQIIRVALMGILERAMKGECIL